MDERILTIDIATTEQVKARMKAAFKGQADTTARHSFASVADMASTLTPNRWRIIEAMTGAGALGVRELARRIDRDVKTVHTDAQALVLCGLLTKNDDGKLLFPFDAVRVVFELHAAA